MILGYQASETRAELWRAKYTFPTRSGYVIMQAALYELIN